MPHVKTIIAATDLSPLAKDAANRAAWLARESAAHLELVHIINQSLIEQLRHFLSNDIDNVDAQVTTEARNSLSLLAEDLHAHHGQSAGLHLSTGAVIPQLVELTHTLRGDLMVVGARGEGFVKQYYLGSTAEKLVQKSPCPVLVVKNAPKAPYRRVLVPVDFSPSSLATLRLVRHIAPTAVVTLLHAYDLPFEGKLRLAGTDDLTIHLYREKVRREASEAMHRLTHEAGLAPGTYNTEVLHGDPWIRIIEQETTTGCDLIAMGKHGNNLLEDLILGSVTRLVLSQSASDVLVYL